MQLLKIVGRQLSLRKVPTFFVSPQLSRYSRPWHSAFALRAKQSSGAASFTAKKSVEKGFELVRGRQGKFTDLVTIKALENIGCQDGALVLNTLCISAQYGMVKRYAPNRGTGTETLWQDMSMSQSPQDRSTDPTRISRTNATTRRTRRVRRELQ